MATGRAVPLAQWLPVPSAVPLGQPEWVVTNTTGGGGSDANTNTGTNTSTNTNTTGNTTGNTDASSWAWLYHGPGALLHSPSLWLACCTLRTRRYCDSGWVS